MKRLLPFAAALTVAACGSVSGRRSVEIPMQVTEPLSADAQAIAAREGFVIVDRANDRAPSFHLGYSALFRAHQPLYVTADAVLYAWHCSYDDALAIVEVTSLLPALRELLASIGTQLAHKDPDLDVYIGVAAALLSGQRSADETVAELVTKSEAAEGPGEISLFGKSMAFDFSMMKPRGHYTKSVALTRYFRAMTWLGRVELRISENDVTNPRALGAVKMLRASIDAGAERTWKMLDATIGTFVGPRDSMSIPEWDANQNVVQRIGTQLAGPGHRSIAFVLLGQRYVFDSHVFSALTYGQLQTKRMMPSPLDVGYVVFANPSAERLLAPEVKRWGAEYEHALESMIDERKRADWQGSLVSRWLAALRELSPDAARDAALPPVFRTDAWGRRMLDTQLASWAELRHDNVLYAKQSVTAYALCEYPHGYVDPYPRFWAALESMAKTARGVATNERLVKHFEHFAEVARRLRVISERERRDEPLISSDIDFLNHMVSVDGRHAGCSTILEAEGWYAELFLEKNEALYYEPIIADVHTQPTDETGNVVGHVLHVGTSYPRLFAVTHSGRTYRGFVSSYAETTTDKFKRLDDAEWEQMITARRPESPPWLKDLVSARPQ